FWDKKELRDFYLKNHFPKARTKEDVRGILFRSAKMELPSQDECIRVILRSKYSDEKGPRSALNDLAKEIPVGKYGLYLDGDVQKLFLLKKTSEISVQFVTSFTTSTSADGFSNLPNSGGTPVGM